jgi:hypothetical protein
MLLASLQPQAQMRCSSEAAVQRQAGRVALTAVAPVDAGSVDSSACGRCSDVPAQCAADVAGAAPRSNRCLLVRRQQSNVCLMTAGGCSCADGC